ncbi:MAG: hypothetical protein EAZ42_00730 [Verrucomicrobia bacterium]|nr:MAG: hypothetical protein EAZ42_00730 [Verrucomicrobiota bacterium]
MKTWLTCAFLCALLLASCNKHSKNAKHMGSIDVVSTIKTTSGLTVQYSIPETEGGWHCAGANLNVKDDLVELSFVAAHDADDGARVDLPAENTNRPNIHQVHIPLNGLNEGTSKNSRRIDFQQIMAR